MRSEGAVILVDNSSVSKSTKSHWAAPMRVFHTTPADATTSNATIGRLHEAVTRLRAKRGMRPSKSSLDRLPKACSA